MIALMHFMTYQMSSLLTLFSLTGEVRADCWTPQYVCHLLGCWYYWATTDLWKGGWYGRGMKVKVEWQDVKLNQLWESACDLKILPNQNVISPSFGFYNQQALGAAREVQQELMFLQHWWKALCKYKVSPWGWRILFQPPHCVVDSAYCEFDIFNYFACPI